MSLDPVADKIVAEAKAWIDSDPEMLAADARDVIDSIITDARGEAEKALHEWMTEQRELRAEPDTQEIESA